MKIKIISTLVALLFSCFLFSQDSKHDKLLDSLFRDANAKATEKEKVESLTGNAGKYGYDNFTKQLIDKSIEISEKSNSPISKANSYYSLGVYYLFRSEIDTSKVLLSRSLKLIETNLDPTLKAEILTSFAEVYRQEGNYDEGISTLFKAKELFKSIRKGELSEEEKKDIDNKENVVNNSFATLYKELGDFESSLHYYKLSYHIAIKSNNLTTAGAILSNKGVLLSEMGNYQEALEAHIKAKELKASSSASQRSIAISELNIGSALVKLKRFDEAIQSFDSVVVVFKKIGFPIGELATYIERGELGLTISNINNAIDDCEKAKSIAFKIKATEYQESACKCLYNAYKKIGNTKLALVNLELYQEKKEMISSEKNIKKITQLEMQYDFDRKEELRVAENKAKEKQNDLIIKSLTGGLGALLLIALLLYYVIRLRKKAEIKLEGKNVQLNKAIEEKEILLKEIHHRVKNNLQIISSLLNIQGRQIDDKLAKQAINEGKNRVKAMALIHQNLYQNENLVGVDAGDYIYKLSESLVQNYKISENEIEIITDIEEIIFDVDIIIPFGLIINELISNSLKYAFPSNQTDGKIYIKLKQTNNNLILEVSDNGIGLPKDFKIEETSTLGYKLIKSFSKKLKAKLDLGNNIGDKGTKVRLEIANFKTI